MLGSVLSRATYGSAPFLAGLTAGAVLVGTHWPLRLLTAYVPWAGSVVKGDPVVLIQDGTVRPDGMRRAGLSAHDLGQALRAHARLTDPSQVRPAPFERNGTVSGVPARRPPLHGRLSSRPATPARDSDFGTELRNTPSRPAHAWRSLGGMRQKRPRAERRA